jgi:hypothetical protein
MREWPVVSNERQVYCNRTMNLRSIKAIGYDMDYTLVHYRVDEWERVAFEHQPRNRKGPAVGFRRAKNHIGRIFRPFDRRHGLPTGGSDEADKQEARKQRHGEE